ncbi:MAG: hypothetical protein GY820_44360 [Gammaproteobacteria bacterium]|nr:hypothetical protein [Gammaproteobacteria bacterium]
MINRRVEKRPTVLKCLVGKDTVMKRPVEKQSSGETSGGETTYSAEVSGGNDPVMKGLVEKQSSD